MKLVCLIGIVAFSLAGCGSFPPKYPVSLPSLVPGDSTLEACPQIAGRYADMGSATDEDGINLGPVSLTSLYSPSTQPLPAGIVAITGPERGLLRLEAFDKGKSVSILELQRLSIEYASQFHKEGYFCEGGFIRIRDYVEAGSASPAPVGMFVSDQMWLRKATDDSLILLRVKRTGGLALIVPWGDTKVIWYRFQPIATVNQSEAYR